MKTLLPQPMHSFSDEIVRFGTREALWLFLWGYLKFILLWACHPVTTKTQESLMTRKYLRLSELGLDQLSSYLLTLMEALTWRHQWT